MSTTAFIPSSSSQIGEHLYQLPLDGLVFFEITKHSDERGFYSETSIIPDFEKALGTTFLATQTNLAYSAQSVARGFHAEQWDKLVTVFGGSAMCAWIDLRPNSNTAGEIVTMQLGEGDGAHFGSVYVKKGIGNGYIVDHGPIYYSYMVNALYRERNVTHDAPVSLFDPSLDLHWPIDPTSVIISERDKNMAISLEEYWQLHGARA